MFTRKHIRHIPRIRNDKFPALVMLILLGTLILSLSPACHAADPQPRRVLLIGNSLTANGYLGQQLQEIVRSAGEKIEIAQSLIGNSSLQQHIASPNTRAAVANGPWDAVVMWEHSMVLASERLRREAMLTAGRAMVERIRAQKARPILVMVWGRRQGDTETILGEQVTYKDYATLQETERQACEDFSKTCGVDLAPAGLAWKAFREKYPEVELYSDNMHANAAGAYLAALTIYATIYNRTPRPINWHPAEIPNDLAKKLHDVATESWEQYINAKEESKTVSRPKPQAGAEAAKR